MIISDRIDYRADGTISAVWRTRQEVFTTPSGREISETFTTEVSISDLMDGALAAYAELDQRNKALEAQIRTERATAEAEKLALRSALAEAQATKR